MKNFIWGASSVLFLGLVIWFWPRQVPADDLPVVDIDVGEPFVDVRDRSTYDFGFTVLPPLLFSVPLAAYENERNGYYFLRLRNGYRSVQFPWFPAYADIDITMGQTDGMEIEFLNFPISVPENRGDMKSSGGGSLIVPDLEMERQAFIDIYFMLESLKMRRLATNCYSNKFLMLPPCDHSNILPKKAWTPEELGVEFDNYVNEWMDYWGQDDVKFEDRPRSLMIARWISDLGAIMNLSVHPAKVQTLHAHDGIPLLEQEFSMQVSINIQNPVTSRRSGHVRGCFGSLDVSERDIRYDFEQARLIYGTVFDGLGPLLDENGKPITDLLVISQMDYSDYIKLADKSWGELPPNIDRGKTPQPGEPEWCSVVKELEKEVGYEGP